MISVGYHESRDELNSYTYTAGLSACFKFNCFSKFTSSGDSCSDDDTVVTSLHKILPVLNLNYFPSTLITDKIFYRGYY